MDEICIYRSDDIFFHHSLCETPDPDAFAMHAHESNEVLIFLSGEAKMLVEGNEYRLTPGSVLLMRAGESHKICVFPTAPYERIAIRFDLSVLTQIDPKGELYLPFQNRRLGSGNLFHLNRLESLLPCVMELDSNSSSYHIRLTVITFLYSLLLEACNLHIRQDRGIREREALGKNYEMIEYINQNLSADLSLDAIAARFFLSKSQLSRNFKKATGSTLWDYVLIKRLLLARSLIREGESITEACEKSGFKEYSSFYRAYKKRFGISPNQDRHSAADLYRTAP